MKLPRVKPKSLAEYKAMSRRGAEASARKAWLEDPSRPQPSLPKVKWLDRPDP